MKVKELRKLLKKVDQEKELTIMLYGDALLMNVTDVVPRKDKK